LLGRQETSCEFGSIQHRSKARTETCLTPKLKVKLELSIEQITFPVLFRILNARGQLSQNKVIIFSERMSSCFAKVFSPHLGNDLYLREKEEEYPVL